MLRGTFVPALLVLAAGLAAGIGLPSFKHQVQLDRHGNYIMKWNHNEEDIEIQVEVATRGYVGLGFSPTGGMRGADIILGWVDESGKPYLSDRHGTGNKTPQEDASQDVELLGASHNDTHTTLRFRRPLVPCDRQHDMPISSSTMRVIWAYDGSTALSPNSSRLPYHDHRGALSLYMAGDERLDFTAVPHVQAWDVLAPNVSLPNDVDTLYWCKMYKMPELKQKHHFIGYEPHIADHMVPYVHHMILYECHAPGVNSSHHFEQWVDQVGAQCYAANMPESWNGCNMPLVVWAVGARGFSLPKEAGFPLGEEHNGATYFMLEIHYSNPNMIQDLVDSSGVRIFHTPELRPYDAGVLQFGHSVEPFQIIPPSTVWHTTGHCHSECTRLTLPASGITVFSGALHAHILGTGVRLQHIRGGVELPPLVEDDMYDFNYQQERVLPQPRTVLPGDHLIATCRYDATHKPATTYGGFKTTDEMCLVFTSYYPRQRVTECHSRPDVALLLDTLGVLDMRDNSAVLNGFQMKPFDVSNVNEDRERIRIVKMNQQTRAGGSYEEFILAHFFSTMIIDAPEALNGTTLLAFLNDRRTWQNASVLRTLQDRVTSGQYEPHCVYSGRSMPDGMPRKAKYPQFAPYIKVEPVCKETDSPLLSAAPTVHSPSMVDFQADDKQSSSKQGQHHLFGYLPTVNLESNFQVPREILETSGYRNPSVLQDDAFEYSSAANQGTLRHGDELMPHGKDASHLGVSDEPLVSQHPYTNEADHHLPLNRPSSRDEYLSFGDDIATIHEQLLKNVNQAPVDVYSFATYSPDPTREDSLPTGEQNAWHYEGVSEEGTGRRDRGEEVAGEHLAHSTSRAPAALTSTRFHQLIAFVITFFVL